jgi:hypothetical protein
MANLCVRFNGTLEDRDVFLPVARLFAEQFPFSTA